MLRSTARASLLVLSACGASAAEPASAPIHADPFRADEPTLSAACEPITRSCAAELRVVWPSAFAPLDAQVLLDGREMDAARLGAGECVVPGAHVLEVHAGLVSEGVVTARHGTERIDVPADGRLVVDVEAGLDAGTLATTSTLQHGESVISSGRCPIFASTQPSELARVVVSLLPERSHRVRLLRVRAAIDGVLVVDRDGSGSESGEPEPSLASGWVAPGEHLLALEHTYLHAYGGYTPTRPRTACGTRSPSSSRPQARRCECVRVSTGG